MSSDFGLQFGEYTVFQHETQVFPRLKTNGAVNSQGYFDLDNLFINNLPDDYHLQFSLKFPSGMPSSIQLASPMSHQESWGMSYYVYAYVTQAATVEELLGKQPTDHMFWTKLVSGKKSSKVFLSFSKLLVSDPAKLTSLPASVEAYKTGFLSDEPSLKASAKLDKPAYQYGDVIGVNVKIDNPSRTKISGLRVNIKQLVTIKIGGDPKNVIKTCIGRYSFSNNREEMLSFENSFHHTISSLKDVATFSDTLKIRPHIDPMRYLYQLALESKLPRSEQGSPVLAPSCSFEGGSWPLGGGLDRLKVFSVEYYLNVHVVIPWSKNLILKIPFKLVNTAGQSPFPTMQETLNAPIFANLAEVTLDSSRASVMDDLKDLRPVPSNLMTLEANTAAISPVSSTPSTVSPKFEDKVVISLRKPSKPVEAPRTVAPTSTLKADLTLAKKSLIDLRRKLADEQHMVLQTLLDANSLILRFDPRRVVLIKEFLGTTEEILTTWLPQMSQKASALGLVKSLQDLSLFDPIAGETTQQQQQANGTDEENVVARCLVQSIVGRLGLFHSQLVQFQSPRSVQEAKLEALNNVIDDLELMLTRFSNGLEGKFDDAGRRISVESIRELIVRIQKKLLDLVSVIPFYDAFDQELLRVKSKITAYGLVEEHRPAVVVDTWTDDFDGHMEQLAGQFEAISTLMTSSDLSGTKLMTTFTAYVDALIGFIQAVPTSSDLAGVAIFWQWQYLHAIIDAYYCGGAEHSLLLPDRQTVNWCHRVKVLIPPQWDLLSAESNRLHLVGTRVIAAMQQLVDQKNTL